MDTLVKRPKPPTVAELKKSLPQPKDVNAEHQQNMSNMDKLALFITEHVGTMGFFFIIMVWTIFWLGWNFLAPPRLRFDPPMGFVFWLFISNMIQIFLMPLIMIGQNLQNRHSELRAENDYLINCKAEKEVEAILHHLEYQNDILITMLESLGPTAKAAIAELKAHHINPPTDMETPAT
ncbi:MAG TPA: DUF1003 domain-containing protein [Capsulimonadaceae bacterium]|nr:DUF1003 domain-containing protein [Capsulimonadaceae bacterium]